MSKTVRHDGYVNMMNKYGTAKDSSTAYQYQHDYYTSDTLLTDQYSSNGLFARIIDAPADEAVKHGFTLTIENEEITRYIIDQLEMLDWEDAFSTAEKWSRLYGGAIIVMLADDGGRLEEPLNIQRTRSVDALYVFERAVVTPNYDGLSDYGFSKPNSFSVSSIAGSFTVHSSRCLIFRNGRLPELVPDLNYRYFGFPEYHRIKQQLRETVTSHSYASKLLERSVQPVHKIKDLASLMATHDGEEEILKRLDLVDTARGIMNTIAIDADGEDYAFQTFSFTGVQEIIDVHCNILSAVTSIPQTILFGRSPAGMNATGYSDFENYYNMIEHIQKRNMKGNLRTLINLIIRQGKACGEILDAVGDFKIEFNPLWNLSETEQAQVAAQKMSTASAKAAVAQTYIDLGVLDPTEVRATLKTDDIFAIDDSLDEELEEAAEMAEEDAMAQIGNSPIDTGGSSITSAPTEQSQQQSDTSNLRLTTDENSDRIKSNSILDKNSDGGKGSGNFGHKNQKGEVGGSLPNGGGNSYLKAREYFNEIYQDLVSDERFDTRKGYPVEYKPANVDSLSAHAKERFLQRGVTEADAQKYIDTASVCFKQEGNTMLYLSQQGATVIDVTTKRLVTVYPAENFDPSNKYTLEVIKKYE